MGRTGLCLAAPSAAAWDINTGKETHYGWMLAVRSFVNETLAAEPSKKLANSGLNFISGLCLVNQMKHLYLPLSLKHSIFDIHVQREILYL